MRQELRPESSLMTIASLSRRSSRAHGVPSGRGRHLVVGVVLTAVLMAGAGCSAGSAGQGSGSSSEAPSGQSSTTGSAQVSESSASSDDAGVGLPLAKESKTIEMAGRPVTLREVDVPPGSWLRVVQNHPWGVSVDVYPPIGGKGGYQVKMASGVKADQVLEATADSQLPVSKVMTFGLSGMTKHRSNDLGDAWWTKHDPATAHIGELKKIHKTAHNAPNGGVGSTPLASALLGDLWRIDLPIEERAAIMTLLTRLPNANVEWSSHEDGDLLEFTFGVEDVNPPEGLFVDPNTGFPMGRISQAAVVKGPIVWLDRAVQQLDDAGACTPLGTKKVCVKK